MTLSDLVAEVSSLGFDGEIDCDTLFLTSLKRCLTEIFTTQSITSHTVLHKSKERVSARPGNIHYNGCDAISLPLAGHAICFYTTGHGYYTITSGGKSQTFTFSGERTRHTRLFGGSGKIVFSGDAPYDVTDIAVFSDFYSDENDVPDSAPKRKYDMKKTVDDFLDFASSAKDDDGRELACVSFSSGCIFVDGEYEGNIHITYRRLPKISINSNPEREIDIPREYEHLLPVLLASYVYLDTDSKKSQYYREIYTDMIKQIRGPRVSDKLCAYKDTNGWA